MVVQLLLILLSNDMVTQRAEKPNTRLAESKNEVAVNQKILTQLQETMQTREELRK